jgi:hypothetical protein
MVHSGKEPALPAKPAVNHLIASLPRKDREHFISRCDPVELRVADVLSKPGARIREVYFPTGSVISLMTPAAERSSLEVGLLGSEGMLGSSLALGVAVWPLHAMVQGSGPALRMDAARFGRELEQLAALRRQLQRYVYVLMDQLAQGALCTRFHLVEARLARWLLMTQDRAHSSEFHVTHESLASMLGVRRVGVTRAAGALQKGGLIGYSRGNVAILDRDGLEAASCDCYAADKATYARVMC